MQGADEQRTPVKVKAALIDPETMTVVWTNVPASEPLPDRSGDTVPEVPLDHAVPMPEALGVPRAVRSVASTGVPQHLQTDLVSTARGSVAMVVSIYRLPGGMVLVLTENAWQVGHRSTRGNAGSGPSRRER